MPGGNRTLGYRGQLVGRDHLHELYLRSVKALVREELLKQVGRSASREDAYLLSLQILKGGQGRSRFHTQGIERAFQSDVACREYLYLSRVTRFRCEYRD